MRTSRILLAATACCAIAAIFVAFATAASPTATTSAATGVGNDSATLNGSINPQGSPTSYAFQWGQTASYGHETEVTSGGTGTGTGSENENAKLADLQPGTTYHFRMIALNGTGSDAQVGDDQTFTTTGTAPGSTTPPTVTTGSAANQGTDTFDVSGMVNPQGNDATEYFEYGTSTNYGRHTAPVDAGSGSANVNAAATLSNLQPGTTYHYRLVSFNDGATALGADQTTSTLGAPAATTGTAGNVTATSATLTGTTVPNGAATTYYFQYGPTTAYGTQSAPVTAGAGTGAVAAATNITGLTSGTVYHFRLVAQSAAGTTYGADAQFTAGVQSSHVAFIGREGFVSPGKVIGVEASCLGGSTDCSGHVTMTHNNTVVGQRDFTIAANTGGFENMKLTSQGAALLKNNRVHALLAVKVTITPTGGTPISQTIHLARWVWN